MPTSKELREQRMNLENQISALLDKAEAENRDLTSEEDAQYRQMFSDSRSLLNRAERLEKRDASMADLSNSLRTNEGGLQNGTGLSQGEFGARQMTRDQALNIATQGWFKSQIGCQYTDEEMEAAQTCGMNLQSSHLVLNLINGREYDRFRNQYRNSLTTVGAGAMIPEGFIPRLERALLDYSPVSNEAEMIRTSTGGPMPWPTMNDTGNKGRQIGETKSVEEKKPTLGGNVWYAWKFTSDELLISYELFEDNGVNLDAVVPDMLGERIGRILNEKFTIGDGASTPYGLVPGATVGKTAAATNAITLDEVLDLSYSVQNPYRRSGKFMGNDQIFLKMRKLKNSTGDYLWETSVQVGMPDVFDGSPVVPNNDMTDTLSASAIPLLFGDFRYYKVRQVNQVRFHRLEERHREEDQTAFLAFVRADGRILDAGGHPIKSMQMAAA